VPVYRRESLPADLPWIEVDDFETFVLDPRLDAGTRNLVPTARHERAIVLAGEVVADSELGRVTLRRNDWIQLPASGASLQAVRTTAEVMRIAGHWSETTILTLFQVRPDKGLELHYHDGDEYWIFFRGRGRAVSEGVEYELGPGDMVATGMGHEHGMPPTTELVEAVAFETALYGQRRRGHLHREEHGVPVPARELAVAAGAR
jgi:mannose-6-phosphate isomerase-like protein (cupin superfamily)